jgi:hypothetical protein
MKKHILNLQRLHQKMLARYGEDDNLVSQLTQEIKLAEAAQQESKVGSDRRQQRDQQLASPAPLQ